MVINEEDKWLKKQGIKTTSGARKLDVQVYLITCKMLMLYSAPPLKHILATKKSRLIFINPKCTLA